ncbi:MAG: hypothetical protein ACRCWC_04205 [Plesiomonas shigelloides]
MEKNDNQISVRPSGGRIPDFLAQMMPDLRDSLLKCCSFEEFANFADKADKDHRDAINFFMAECAITHNLGQSRH